MFDNTISFITNPELLKVVIRLLVASLLGGLIGFERDIHGRPAGLRTHLLVSLGASIFMLLSPLISTMSKNGDADPGRVAAQIVTGIGFLGAGAIIKEGLTIHGLTTAACLWVAAAIGMAIGGGYYQIGILATVIALFFLIILSQLEKFFKRDTYKILSITTANDLDISKIVDNLKCRKIKVLLFDFKKDYDSGLTTAKLSVRLFHEDITSDLYNQIIESIEKSGVEVKQIKLDHS